jgi:hypothetical protein
MANLSLQEQLLNAGLSDNNKVKKIKADKRKQTKKKQKNKIEVVDETKIVVDQNKAKQLEKDKRLNQQRNQAAVEKQIAAQILQLIDINKLAQDKDGIAYNFSDQNKVKIIYISEEIRNNIIAGRLAIVKSRKSYEVVATGIAEKIKQRDESLIIVLFSSSTKITENDEYQAYEIPDDLIW